VFFVEERYHHNPKRATDQVRYIAHREEGLRDGRRRELYGMDRKEGIVVRWKPDRGYGFIEGGEETFFFHRTFMSPGSKFEDARPGQRVTFWPHRNARGLDAFDVRLEERAPNVQASSASDMTIDNQAPTSMEVVTREQPRAFAASFDEPAETVRNRIETLAPGGTVTVDAVVKESGPQRIAVVREMQRWAAAGLGTFMVGRRGRPSRFIKTGPGSGGQSGGNSKEVQI
jgi:cold shock CspA family protein